MFLGLSTKNASTAVADIFVPFRCGDVETVRLTQMGCSMPAWCSATVAHLLRLESGRRVTCLTDIDPTAGESPGKGLKPSGILFEFDEVEKLH